MESSEKEIVRTYMMAKEKGKQIKILAELNCCSKEKIIEILKNNGVDVNGRVFNGGNHKKPKEESKDVPVNETLKACHEIIQAGQEAQAETIKILPKVLHTPESVKNLIESEISRYRADIIRKEEAIAEFKKYLKDIEEYEGGTNHE